MADVAQYGSHRRGFGDYPCGVERLARRSRSRVGKERGRDHGHVLQAHVGWPRFRTQEWFATGIGALLSAMARWHSPPLPPPGAAISGSILPSARWRCEIGPSQT